MFAMLHRLHILLIKLERTCRLDMLVSLANLFQQSFQQLTLVLLLALNLVLTLSLVLILMLINVDIQLGGNTGSRLLLGLLMGRLG